ncbi:hypothetical protein B0H19DRAFT_1104747 [Mycena capillaripes]|nr:hypothetical protein B0H19DRAFT_1104747 [Mycena capillaripes]
MFSRAEVAPATVLVALVYIARARAHLTIALEEWALERVFLGALIVASKYTQDSTLKNVHWALCTGIFGRGDIGRIEREFLEVIDWELGVQESDLLAHHEGLVAAASGVQFEARVNVKLAPAKAEVEEMDVQELAISPPYSPPSPAGAVPELEPSSPQSSAGSLSPRTPVSHAVLPMDVDVALPATSPPPAPRPNSKKRAHAHAHRCKRLHSFLHSFHPHHHQHHHAVEVAA